MKKTIAITGGIGAGKTKLMEVLFKEFPNCNFHSVDDEVRRMYTDPLWREYLISTYGTADRRKISAMAFSDPAILKDLDDQSAEYLQSIIERWSKDYTPDVEMISLIEFPLLFERNYEKKFDVVVLVTAPKELRIERVMKRDSKTREQVEAIMRNQMSDEEKAPRADFIVDTSKMSQYDELILIAAIKNQLANNRQRPLCVKV